MVPGKHAFLLFVKDYDFYGAEPNRARWCPLPWPRVPRARQGGYRSNSPHVNAVKTTTIIPMILSATAKTHYDAIRREKKKHDYYKNEYAEMQQHEEQQLLE